MAAKHKIIFFFIVIFLFLFDIGSKKYVFDYFSVVISETPPEDKSMQQLYDGNPKVYVKKDYEPLELVKSYYTFTFSDEYIPELSFFYVSESIKDVFKKHGYELSEKAYVVRQDQNTWKITDWRMGKRYFITRQDDRLNVSSSFFSFLVVINRGAIWGIMQGRTIVLTLFSLFAIAFIIYIVFRSDSKPYFVPLAFISSGAFGNLWDRLFFNGVRDFLDFNLGFMQWPTFNFADVFIISGVILYMIIELYISWKTKKTEKKGES